MDAESPMQGLWLSERHEFRDNHVAAHWEGTALPDELVHYVLGWLDTASGGPGGWLDKRPAVSVDIEVAFRIEDLPF